MIMNRRNNRDDIPKKSEIADITESVDFNDIVSEGTTVVLDAQDLIKNTDSDSIKKYSWKQTGGTTTTKLSDDKSRRFSFVAPYIKGNTITTELSFELTADNTNGKPATYTANVIVKRIQRALVFQGGVALGAYEAGVFRALVEKITEENIKRGLNERPLFGIIAGTSIGAMNAANYCQSYY